MTCFKIMSRHLRGKTKVNHEKPLGQLVTRPIFEPATSRTQVCRVRDLMFSRL